MLDKNDQQRIQEMINVAIRKAVEYQTRKRGDTPTDDLQLTPLGFVTMNGSVAGRPNSSVATVGQFYLSTDTNIPMWFTQGGWRNGVGSIVSQA